MVIRRQEFTVAENLVCNSVARDNCISLRQCTGTKTHRHNVYWVKATLSWVKALTA